MRGILALAPFYLVDFLLNLKGFEVVKFGFVGLELSMEFVFAGLLLREDQDQLDLR